MKALFPLGRLVITPVALDFCNEHRIDPLALVVRHVNGDFGDVCKEDWEANVRAIQEGTRIFSSYQFEAGKVWIITEADRSSTCILLPDDY
jgi:hypothetical protein